MTDGLPGILNLAAASGEELGTTSDIVTDALTAFGLKAKDSAHFSDILASTSSNANTNVSMLGESFKYVAPVAGSLGINAKDTSFALGLMANAGIKGSAGGTALRSSLVNLAKPTKKMKKAMDKLGISLTDSHGKVKEGKVLFDELRQKFSKLSDAQKAQYASTIFGKEAMSGMLAIINASDKDYNKLYKNLSNCDGASKKMADTNQKNLKGTIEELKSAFEEMQISLAQSVIPILTKVVKGITKVVNAFNKLPQPVKNAIGLTIGSIALLAPVFLILGKLVSSTSLVIGAFGKLGKSVSLFSKIPKVISKSGKGTTKALSFLNKGISKGFKGIGKGVTKGIKIFSKIPITIKTMSKSIVKIFKLLGKVTGTVFKGIGKVILKGASIFKMLPALITPHTAIIVAAIAAIGLIVYQVIKHWDALKKAGQNLWKSLGDICKKIGGFFGKSIKGWKVIWKGFTAFMGKIGSWICDGLLGGLKKGWEGVKKFTGKMGKGIKNTFKDVLGIHSPSTVFSAYGGFIGEGLLNGLDGQEDAINTKFKGIANKIKGLGNVKPKFAGLNNLALGGACDGSSGFNNISNSNKNMGITQNVKMYITIQNADKEGADAIAQEFKGQTEVSLKNSMVDLFMQDATRN